MGSTLWHDAPSIDSPGMRPANLNPLKQHQDEEIQQYQADPPVGQAPLASLGPGGQSNTRQQNKEAMTKIKIVPSMVFLLK
jgi:hypothetical protein